MPYQHNPLPHEYTTKEAAELFGVKDQTIRKMCWNGRFETAKKRFGCWFISKDEVDDLAADPYNGPKPRNYGKRS